MIRRHHRRTRAALQRSRSASLRSPVNCRRHWCTAQSVGIGSNRRRRHRLTAVARHSPGPGSRSRAAGGVYRRPCERGRTAGYDGARRQRQRWRGRNDCGDETGRDIGLDKSVARGEVGHRRRRNRWHRYGAVSQKSIELRRGERRVRLQQQRGNAGNVRRRRRSAEEVRIAGIVRAFRDGAGIRDAAARQGKPEEGIIAAVRTDEVGLLADHRCLRFAGRIKQDRIAACRRKAFQGGCKPARWRTDKKCRANGQGTRREWVALNRAAVGRELIDRTTGAVIFDHDFDAAWMRAGADETHLDR